MGRPPDEDRTGKIELQCLKPHHRAMARYAAAGKRPQDIAQIFGLSVPQVSIVMNSPLFKAEMDRVIEGLELSMKDAATELQELTGRATEVLAEELYAGEKGSKLRARVAFEVLYGTAMLKRGGDVQIGDKNINIINYTPEPGQDPKVVEAQLSEVRKKEKGNGDNQAIDGPDTSEG